MSEMSTALIGVVAALVGAIIGALGAIGAALAAGRSQRHGGHAQWVRDTRKRSYFDFVRAARTLKLQIDILAPSRELTREPPDDLDHVDDDLTWDDVLEELEQALDSFTECTIAVELEGTRRMASLATDIEMLLAYWRRTELEGPHERNPASEALSAGAEAVHPGFTRGDRSRIVSRMIDGFIEAAREELAKLY